MLLDCGFYGPLAFIARNTLKKAFYNDLYQLCNPTLVFQLRDGPDQFRIFQITILILKVKQSSSEFDSFIAKAPNCDMALIYEISSLIIVNASYQIKKGFKSLSTYLA